MSTQRETVILNYSYDDGEVTSACTGCVNHQALDFKIVVDSSDTNQVPILEYRGDAVADWSNDSNSYVIRDESKDIKYSQTNVTMEELLSGALSTNTITSYNNQANLRRQTQRLIEGFNTADRNAWQQDGSFEPSVEQGTTQENGIDPSPIPIPTTDITVDVADSSKVRQRYAGSSGAYVYPLDMRSTTQDRIEFKMIRYVGQTISGANPTLGERFNGREQILGTAYLPIQSGIRDANGIDWGGGKLNPLQAYLAGAAVGLIGGEGTDTNFLDRLDATTQQAKKDISNFLSTGGGKDAATVWFAQQAVGVRNLLSRASGAVVNPNLELLFNGPLLRNFTFNFRFSPREEREAWMVKHIIRFFKQGSSVKTGASQVFLKAPNVFKLKYITYRGNTAVEHPSINRIKTCALTGCDVDYTPDNNYMTFNDEQQQHPMTAYNMSLKFSELTPVTEDDYFDAESSYSTSGRLSTRTHGSPDIGF